MVQVTQHLEAPRVEAQNESHKLMPHNFRTLRRSGTDAPRPSVLVVGAGLSYRLVPQAGELLRTRREVAERKLGITSKVPINADPKPDHLYEWAQDMIGRLRAAGDPNPKLSLANAIGIPRDDHWHVHAVPKTSTPRHRVIARFAREGLWDQIWSLNWDCVQETAFEHVGLKRDGDDLKMPWPTRFRSFVTAADCMGMGEDYTVKIAKPHGCAKSLAEAGSALKRGDAARVRDLSERFLIAADELAALPEPLVRGATQQFVFASLASKLCELPLVTAGWSASETYLLDHMENAVRPALEQRALADDELSVIDIAFNGSGHVRLAGFYGRDHASAHIPVDTSSFTTDHLFLWLQALYAVGCIEACVLNEGDEEITDVDRAEVQSLAQKLQRPDTSPSDVIDWVDSFLPAWIRLCWRCGLVECRKRDGRRVLPSDVPLESLNEHVPWFVPNIGRPDVVASARLLTALVRSKARGRWDFSAFPGALYLDGKLTIPLPTDHRLEPNYLRGIKPLIDVLEERGIAPVERINVLPLGLRASHKPTLERQLALREIVARELSAVRFRGERIGIVGLEDL